MPGDPDLQSINRTLKEIANSLVKIDKVLKAMNDNYIEVNRTPDTVVTKE